MNNGFIRVGAATIKTKVADCQHNTEQIIEIMHQAEEQQVQIVVFPELTLTGYTCSDLFLQHHLQTEAIKSLILLKEATIGKEMVIIVGAPIALTNGLYNIAFALSKGEIIGGTVKSYIPNYGEFYEKRWFVSGHQLIDSTITIDHTEVPIGNHLLYQHATMPLVRFGIEICEDLWTPMPPSGPMAQAGATMIFNPSASNDLVGKSAYRKNLVTSQSARTMTAYVYASAGYGESTTDVVFGGQCLIAENGSMLAKNKRFVMESQLTVADVDLERLGADRQKMITYSDLNHKYQEDFITCPFDIRMKPYEINRYVDPHPFVPSDLSKRNERCEEIFAIQSMGLAKRLDHISAKKVVIGISGGLDSTLALLVCTRTFDLLGLDRKNIIAITMPGYGTTDRTYTNACDLVNDLGCALLEINIKAACEQHFKDIDHDPSVHNVTYENVQARERTQILMDYANKTGGLVIGTGDLSELALGWATYNGDHMSMYAVNSSIPKSLVRYLVKWVAEHEVEDEASKAVLMDIFDTPVSPELLPPDENGNIEQKTEEVVGPYELHDFFLYYCVRFGFTPTKINLLANIAFKDLYDSVTIKKWLTVFYKRFFAMQFKRSCLPDGPKVGSINLSPRGDWRMPSDAVVNTWLQEIDSL